jgi:hypothetical protein
LDFNSKTEIAEALAKLKKFQEEGSSNAGTFEDAQVDGAMLALL